jgi:hypothetical protein
MTPGKDRRICLHSHCILPLALSTTLISLVACGSRSGPMPAAAATPITVLATSTADDRLTQFTMGVTSLSLVNSSGKEVPVITYPVYAEFIHLNGESEPLFTTRIPPGTYKSAIASVAFSAFDCVDVSQQGGVAGSGYGSGDVKPSKVAITLPKPIEVSETSATIVLNMLAGPSSAQAICNGSPQTPTATPTFQLTQSTTDNVVTMRNLQGIVQYVGSDGRFSVTAIDGPAQTFTDLSGKTEIAQAPQWQVNAGANTAFYGIHDFSGLEIGQPIDMDATFENGAMTATRIAVYNTSTGYLNLFNGPLLTAYSAMTPVFAWARSAVGLQPPYGMTAFTWTGTQFGISSAFTNLSELPFTAKFDASSFTWGQTVDVTTNQPLYSNGYIPVKTVTLMPQTVNGTVQAISTNGSFTEYTISLSPYDLFPQLSLQWGQIAPLSSPNVITVYADKNVQSQTTAPIATGGIYRFNGLVFNDGGTLRMDCAHISDGVID